MSKKALPNLRSQRFTPIFSLNNFIVLALTFRFLTYFELIFVYDVKKNATSFFFPHIYVQFS